MRIYTGQTTNLFQAAAINHSVSRDCPDRERQAKGTVRTDMAFISPQGKSSSLLANLMSQKELIQSNREYLLTKALDEEDGGAAGLQEQLEDYEKQLDSINAQIAAEMAKQAENGGTQGTAGEKPQTNKPQTDQASDGEVFTSDEGTITGLTKLSAELERTQAAEQAQVRREGEKRVCEAEIELGSTAAERKLNKINTMEKLTGQWASVLKRMGR